MSRSLDDPPIVATPTRWGPLKVLTTDVYIGMSLIAYGEFSPAEWRFLCSLVRPGDRVVDVGCNIGAIAAPLAFNGCHVIAADAQAVLAELAQANVREAEVHHVAVGASPGTITVPTIDYRRQNNFGGVSLVPAAAEKWREAMQQGEVEVPLTTVDQLVAGREVALIKADVEGMELDVVRGTSETISRCRPILYLECDRDDAPTPLLDHLIGIDYRWHWHRPPLYSPDNFRQLRYCLRHLEHVVSMNVVAIPRERPLFGWEAALAVVDL